ncbi:MAG TPA: aldose epimerase family protein [Longimicrobiales bacterium]|nr:aldose epimerase family protein [Longimicrobiales bacterium]
MYGIGAGINRHVDGRGWSACGSDSGARIAYDALPMNVHTLRNAAGLELRVADYGGTILSLSVPDRRGRFDDVVLGFDSPEEYRDDDAYLGAIVGRFANRIGGARFVIDDIEYALAPNEPPNHLHGGARGFDDVLWGAEPFRSRRGVGLALAHASPDGDQGYPGTLRASVTYLLTDANELIVEWLATTDRPTHVNLTQHSYFNLAGHDAGDVLGHVLTIDADRYLPVDESRLPTGELRAVDRTPFDFRRPTPIGARIDHDDDQLRIGRGYDHCFVLESRREGAREPEGVPERDRERPLTFAARLQDPSSGRVMDVHTTEPGMQLYTGNGLSIARAKGGARYPARSGLALETQHFPDSPNRTEFPSTLLRPGETYRSKTVYRFGVHDV